MSVQEETAQFISELPEGKRGEIETLHLALLDVLPGCKLWFSNGYDDEGKRVNNPTIGYGAYEITYANGTSREFFQIGLSANKTGISVYILGLDDKTYLSRTYGKTIGKASVTGYCIRFKSLRDVNVPVILTAVKAAVSNS